MSDPIKPVKGKRTVSGHLDWKTTFCNFEGPGGVFFEHPSHGIRRAVLEPRVLRIICSFWGASYEASWHFKAVPDHHFGGIWWYLLIFPAFLHGIWWYLVVSANIPASLCIQHVVRGRPGVFRVKGVQKILLLGPQNYRKLSFSLNVRLLFFSLLPV